MTLPVPF